MWDIIKSGGAFLFAVVVTRLLAIATNFMRNKRVDKRLERMDRELEEYRIVSLGHLKPRFEEIRECDELFIPFPKEMVVVAEDENEKYFQAKHTDWVVFGEDKKETLLGLVIDGINQIKKVNAAWRALPELQIEVVNEIIHESQMEVAQGVVKSLQKGQIRFNGLMLGVREIQSAEKETCIRLFRTDYYTNRVMNRVYDQLCEKGYMRAPQKTDEVNMLYPFMAALGVDILIELKNRTTMIVERSRKLENMKDESLWHVSMNEAVSHTDYQVDSSESCVDEELCVSRGLREELKIPSEAIEIGSVRLTDVYFLQDKCEIGIAGMVNLKKGVTETRVRLAHYGAKDSVLESEKEMKTVVLSKRSVKRFLKSEKMTESCRYLFSVWLCRRGNR